MRHKMSAVMSASGLAELLLLLLRREFSYAILANLSDYNSARQSRHL